MTWFFKRLSRQAGLPPGTIVHIGDKKTEEVKITLLDYDEGHVEEKEVSSIKECLEFMEKTTVTWIDISGIHDLKIIKEVGASFDIHPLTLEGIANAGQRPKYEDLDSYLYVVLRMLSYDDEKNEVRSEQVSLVIGEQYVISFQEEEGDIFDTVRERIRNSKGRIRNMGADYLAYALMDTIVDNYFAILEKLGERIEEIHEELVADPRPKTLQTIHNLKRENIYLRKSVWPLREIVAALERGDSKLIQESTGIFLRNLYDHTIQVMGTVETFRDMVSGMLDIYLSSVSNRMNEVMKVLTIIATIFIPLTFIAGIYGMNFKYMPELEWPFGYGLFWIAAITIGAVMFVFFKRKRWL